jgi:hypothetical protein
MFMRKAFGSSSGFYGLAMNPLTAGFSGLIGTEKAPSNANHHLDSC